MDFKSSFIARAIFVCVLLTLAGCNLPFVEDYYDSIPGRDKGLLFKDDFSDPGSGWPVLEDRGSSISYNYEGLRIFINEPHFDYWSAPVDNYTDTYISVSTSKLGGPDDNGYGILCRLNNVDNFYGFLISSDGYSAIVKVKNGDYSVLSAEEMKYSEAINKGFARNDLLVGCIGGQLTFSVNGRTILEAIDHEYTSGRVGLIASSRGSAGVDIFFDDFIVTKP